MKPDRLSDFATSYDPAALYPLDKNDHDRPYDSMVDNATRWLSKAARGDKPMFLSFCTMFVHGPIQTRDRKRLQQFCDKLGIPFPTDPGSITPNPEAGGQRNPYYASGLSTLDWMLGKLMKVLRDTDDPRNPGHKLIDNSYFILTSDNGAAQMLRDWPGKDGRTQPERISDNTPLREGKAYVYEGGIRIPLIVRGPGIARSSTSDAMVSLVDLFPTFMSMAGAERTADLDLDGCSILPVLRGESTAPQRFDGKERDTIFFYYPVTPSAFAVIRKGPWKLMRNLALLTNGEPMVQLFNLTDDLSETTNLADTRPEIAAPLLEELDAFLAHHKARTPYRNASYRKGDLPDQDKVPHIISIDTHDDKVWGNYETGEGIAGVVEALFLYTVNGGKFPPANARREEWFSAPATLTADGFEAFALPGMTHGIFCLRDENNFLIHSEELPVMSKLGLNTPESSALKNGFAYKPGLAALIKLAESAKLKLAAVGNDTQPLEFALKAARASYDAPLDERACSTAMQNLRAVVLTYKGTVAEADTESLNLF